MPRVGTRKLHYLLGERLAQRGVVIGRDGLFKLLRQENLLIKKKRNYTKTTDSSHWMRRYPDLLKGIEIERPEQVWVADITYVAKSGGYCYLHLITDAYSKLISGYQLSATLSGQYTMKALEMALANRRYSGPLTHHSDRGLQYCSSGYTSLLKRHGIAISMTQDGNPYDNAIAERINGILKDEFGLDDVFESQELMEIQVAQSITIYNNSRPHTSNQMLTPVQMHEQCTLKPRAWHKKTTGTLRGPSGFLP